MPKITVQNEVKSGSEYCDMQVRALLVLKWPETVLSSIGAMFLYVLLRFCYFKDKTSFDEFNLLLLLLQ